MAENAARCPTCGSLIPHEGWRSAAAPAPDTSWVKTVEVKDYNKPSTRHVQAKNRWHALWVIVRESFRHPNTETVIEFENDTTSPWPQASPEVEAAKDAVVVEMMGIGDVDLRAKRVLTTLWQRGWRPTNGT